MFKKTDRQYLNGTHHLLVNADDINLFTENINFIKKDPKGLLGAGKEFGHEVKADKIKYMFVSSPNHRTNSLL